MAMDETQVAATELENVRTKIPILFDKEDTFYSTIEKGEVEAISARDMRIPLEIRPGGRFGHFDPAGGDLGRGEGPSYEKAVINTVHMRHAIEWHKKTEWATDSARKAVVQSVKKLLASGMVEFRRAVDALAVSSDGTGVLGTVSAYSTAGGKDTLVCDSDGYGIRLMRFGQMLSLYTSTLATRRTFVGAATLGGEAPIDLYDLPNKTVRLNGAATTPVPGDKLVVSGLTGTPPVSMFGVPYHASNASTGAWLGLDRALFPEIRANRVNGNGTALALPYARLALNKIGDRLGQDHGIKSQAWMHPCQVQAYEELGQAVMIINKEAKKQNLDLYFGEGEGFQLAGVGIRKHFSWDKKRIDFIVSSLWGRAEMHPAGFYEVDGRKIFEIRGSSGGVATSQIFYVVGSFNLYVTNPAALSYIDNLAVPAGY
jgi:hypothetical protein